MDDHRYQHRCTYGSVKQESGVEIGDLFRRISLNQHHRFPFIFIQDQYHYPEGAVYAVPFIRNGEMFVTFLREGEDVRALKPRINKLCPEVAPGLFERAVLLARKFFQGA